MKLFLLVLVVSFFSQACNNESKKEDTADTTIVDRDTADMSPVVPTGTHAQATVSATKQDTAVSGTVSFDTIPGGSVKMMLNLTVAKLAGKTVSVHIHEHGDCGDMGEGAHGHWNPGNDQHGKWGSSSFHAGDIGNIKLDANGMGTLTIETNRWTIGGNTSTNIIGKAVIVHSGVDDYKTQPTGNSGSRIGCGVIN